MPNTVGKKFYAYEQKQDANTGLQKAKLISHCGKQEKHCPQSENGKNVGEKHHIRVKRHGEYGWNTVERKNQIAEFYYQYRNKQRRYAQQTFFHSLRTVGDYRAIVGFLRSYKELVSDKRRVNTEMF